MSDAAAGGIIVVVVMILLVLGIWWLWRWSGKPPKKSERWTCTRCGMTDSPAYYPTGSAIAEVILWLLGLLPGLLYHMWCKSNSYWGCPYCGSEDLVPEGSPRALEIRRLQERTNA
jgi:hypothetical protein